MQRLLGELLAMVPPDGSHWPRPARQRWITALGAMLDVLYEDGPFDGGRSRPDAAAGDQNHLLPSEGDGILVLDLRTGQPEPSLPQGKHARPGTSTY